MLPKGRFAHPPGAPLAATVTPMRRSGSDASVEAFESRMDARLDAFEARMREAFDTQTRTIVRTIWIGNSILALAVATLAFVAARLT